MAKFKFRLQSYLNIKEKLEDQKKNEYGQAMAAVTREKQLKEKIDNDKAQSIDHWKEKISQRVDPLSCQRYNAYISLLKQKSTEQQKVVIKAEKQAEIKRNELVESMQERKMLDILKEKDHVTFIKEEQQAEQKMVDEIVSYRYNNREE